MLTLLNDVAGLDRYVGAMAVSSELELRQDGRQMGRPQGRAYRGAPGSTRRSVEAHPGGLVKSIMVHDDAQMRVAASPTDDLLVTCDPGGTSRAWAIADGWR